MITVSVDGRSASLKSTEPITSGSVGIPVKFELSEDFDGLACTAVFRGSEAARDRALIDGYQVEVPAECVRHPGGVLMIGVYACDAEGTVVIPTIWVSTRPIEKGAEPSSIDPAGPSPNWAADVQKAAAQAREAAWQALERLENQLKNRVASLTDVGLAMGSVAEVEGVPAYLAAADLEAYAAYGITEPGWYAFSRISAPEGVVVTGDTAVEGAAGAIIEVGADHVDVAVRFGVTAMGVPVTVTWDADHADRVVYKATDLAVRNLDYRTTFYVYDISDYATWEYALTADATFAADKHYYTWGEDGTYTLAEVTAGEAVPAYYVQTGEDAYERVDTGVFAADVTYYTLDDGVYTAAEVAVGETVPAYYTHSKLTFAGMVRNVTYKCPVLIDCPLEIVLPEVADDGHGAWFEFQLRHDTARSITLKPSAEGVKATNAGASASITAGFNIVDLHYSEIDGVKLWMLANVHTNIPS